MLPDRALRVIPESEKNAASTSLPPPPLLRPPAGFPIRLWLNPGAGIAVIFVGRMVTLEWLLYVGDSIVGDLAVLAPSEVRLLPSPS